MHGSKPAPFNATITITTTRFESNALFAEAVDYRHRLARCLGAFRRARTISHGLDREQTDAQRAVAAPSSSTSHIHRLPPSFLAPAGSELLSLRKGPRQFLFVTHPLPLPRSTTAGANPLSA